MRLQNVFFNDNQEKKKTNQSNQSNKTSNDIQTELANEDSIASSTHNFDAEFSEPVSISDFSGQNQYYMSNGVSLTKNSDDTITVKYNGLLAKNGANDMFSVIGYGSNINWEDVNYIHMNRTINGDFEANIPIRTGYNLNLAFKDSANNWDNNSGLNYTFNQ